MPLSAIKLLHMSEYSSLESVNVDLSFIVDHKIALDMGKTFSRLQHLRSLSLGVPYSRKHDVDVQYVIWKMPAPTQFTLSVSLDGPVKAYDKGLALLPVFDAPLLTDFAANDVDDPTVIKSLLATCMRARHLKKLLVAANRVDDEDGKPSYPELPEGFADFTKALRENTWPELTKLEWLTDCDNKNEVALALLECPNASLRELPNLRVANVEMTRALLMLHPMLEDVYIDCALSPKAVSTAVRLPKSAVSYVRNLTLHLADDSCFTTINFASLKSLCLNMEVLLSSLDIVLRACPVLECLSLVSYVFINDWVPTVVCNSLRRFEFTFFTQSLAAKTFVSIFKVFPNMQKLRFYAEDSDNFEFDMAFFDELAKELELHNQKAGSGGGVLQQLRVFWFEHGRDTGSFLPLKTILGLIKEMPSLSEFTTPLADDDAAAVRSQLAHSSRSVLLHGSHEW